MAAFARDVENFTLELGEALILSCARSQPRSSTIPAASRSPCAMQRARHAERVFQRVLLFLKPEFGTSVDSVYRLARLYDRLSERSALVMLAAWRGSTMAVHAAPSTARRSMTTSGSARASAPAERRPDCAAGLRAAVRTAHGRFKPLTISLLVSPGRGNAGRPGPRSRRSRRRDRSGFPSPAALRPTAPAPAAASSARTSARPAGFVIGGLRRRRVEHRVAVEQRDLDEHRAGLLRAAPAHRAEHALGLAAAQIGRHPDG